MTLLNICIQHVQDAPNGDFRSYKLSLKLRSWMSESTLERVNLNLQ